MHLVVSPIAAETIRHLPPGIKRAVRAALRAIASDAACGQPLQRELVGLFKFRVRRFRVVYAVDRVRHLVRVMAVGPRATIYEDVAEQLRARGARRR